MSRRLFNDTPIISTINTQIMPPLINAILNKDITLISSLLNSDADVNFQLPNGITPLHIAVSLYDKLYIDHDWRIPPYYDLILPIITLLLKHGANPNIQDINGATPFFRTCRRNDLHPYAAIKLFLDHGADPNIQDKRGATPFHMFIIMTYYNKYSKYIDMTNYLDNTFELCTMFINHGADPNVKDIDGETPATLALRQHHKHLKLIKLLLNNGADPNIIFHLTSTYYTIPYSVLHNAAENSIHIDIDWFRMIFLHGANPNIQADETNTTPLSTYFKYAKFHDFNIELITLFLTHGANPNIQDKLGNTSLHYMAPYIANKNFINIIELLIDHDTNPHAVNNSGLTILDLLMMDYSSVTIESYDDKIKKLNRLFHTYDINLFKSACKGLKQKNIGLNAILLIGQHMVTLPEKDLIDIIMK